MKNFILYGFWMTIIALAIVSGGIVVSCSQEENTRDDARGKQKKEFPKYKIEEQPESRIKVVESIDRDCGCNNNNATFHHYQVLEMDGHLYLANSGGGIVHLESCPCKIKHEIDTTKIITSY
ncbi:MAG: hypothetical protein WC333_00065 [Dehalococcoidia bacterium]|jgi:hypothetical protein